VCQTQTKTTRRQSVFNRYARRSLQGDQRHGEAACRRVSFVAHTAARSPCVGEIKRMDGENAATKLPNLAGQGAHMRGETDDKGPHAD
jgi:hypothetical protein